MNLMNDKKDLRIGDVVDIQGLKTTVTGFKETHRGQILICTPFGNYDVDLVKKLDEHLETGK